MTKRPRVIYLIALWWWLSFSVAVLAGIRQISSSTPTDGGDPGLVAVLYPVAILLFIWELIALIQLRRKAIWIFVGFLAAWSLLMAYKLPSMLPQNKMVAPPVVLLLVINGFVVWYLSSLSFRVRCARFRQERDEEAMRRYAEKKLRRTPK